MDPTTSSIVVTENPSVPGTEEAIVPMPDENVQPTDVPVAQPETVVAQTEKEQDQNSRRFAALARQKRELARREQELKKREQNFKSAQDVQTENERLKQQLQTHLQLGKQDLEQYLAAGGITNDDLQQYYTKNIKEGKIPDLDSKLTHKAIEEVKKENAELKGLINSLVKEREQEKQYINSTTVNYVLGSEPTRFEATNKLKDYVDAPSVVLELMDQYKQRGVNISVVDACDAVEKYYQQMMKAFLPSTVQSPAATKPVETKNSEQKITRTLDSLSNSIASGPPVRDGVMTREQRRQASIRLLERAEQEAEMKKRS